jgi:flap endonuclease-1
MGNADLRDVAVIRDISYDDLGGRVVAIDAHNWLYRYLTTTVRFTNSAAYTHDGEEVANLIGIVQGLPKLLEADVTPVFVFDGGVTELKSEAVDERREQRERYEEKLERAREEGAEAAEIATLESRTQRLTGVIQETSRKLLDLLAVPVIEAPAEGEAQAAHMVREGDVDYVGTEDYDALLLGAPLTLRQLTSSGDPELMEFEATLEEHGLTWEQLIDAGILMGTDFNEGVSGIGPKTAVKLIREHGDLWAVLEAEDAYVENADLIRELFLHPDVTDDYAFDRTITPDVDAARTYVCEEWGVPEEEVARGFERIETATTQTGLDDWT